MKNQISFLIIVYVLISCSTIKKTRSSKIRILVDSVYVTQTEDENDFNYSPVMYFLVSIQNNSIDSIHSKLRYYPFLDSVRDISFLICNRDTVELFAAGNGPDEFRINPNSILNIGFKLDAMSVGTLYLSRKVKQSIALREIVKKSKILLIWNGKEIDFIKSKKIKIKFRDPNNTSIN